MTERAHTHSDADLYEGDIVRVLRMFYATVTQDPLLARYFADIDMEAHLPIIADFWSTMLFQTGRYSRNAFRPHLEMPGLASEHFGRWLETLEQTVDALHAGENAERMKALGHRIAYSMQVRLGIAPAVEYRTDLRRPAR